MTRTKITIIYCRAGSGHVNSAEALKRAFMRETNCAVETVDIGNFNILIKLASWVYTQLSRHRPGWVNDLWNRWLWPSQNGPRPAPEKTATWLERYATGRLNALIGATGANAVVFCCAPFAVSTKHLAPGVPVYVCVTDAFDRCTPDWWHPAARLVFSPSAANAAYLRNFWGVDASRFVVGNPIYRTEFDDAAQLPREACRQRVGIPTVQHGGKVLLVNSCGSVALASILACLETLSPADQERLTVVVLTYSSHSVHRYVEKLKQRVGSSFVAVPWTPELSTYFRAADLVYTKPGPGVVVESLATKTPLLVNCLLPVMEQEQSVLRFVVDHDLGLAIQAPADFTAAIRSALDEGANFERLRLKAEVNTVRNGSLKIAREIACDLAVRRETKRVAAVSTAMPGAVA